MERHDFLKLTSEDWDRAAEEHSKRQRFAPQPLSLEDAESQFCAGVRMILMAAAGRYANSIRKQNGHAPLRQPPLPRDIAAWLDEQLNQVDSWLGHPGARTYQSIANGLFAQLQSAERWFLKIKE